MSYTNSLEKGSKKHICPKCNKKRYVRFINNETNEYLDYNFGRCDRETSCGYFNKPNDLGETTITPIEPIKQIPISTIQNSIAVASLKKYDDNNLFLFLIKYFNKEQVLKTFINYNVGTSKKWNGSTVFWQIDNLNRHRTGKIMLYNTINGKRFKKPYNHISWVHKALKIDNYNLKQCLFGLHLVSGTNKSIAIVESEKTALTMKLFLPEYTWIATGSKQNLKYELLYPIKNHKIILYPDKGEYNDWNKKCSELIGQGFNISCSQLVENSKGKKGTDLADIYFQLENEASQKPVLTNIENKLHKLHSKNPKIKSLIEAFCLTDEGGNIIKLI